MINDWFRLKKIFYIKNMFFFVLRTSHSHELNSVEKLMINLVMYFRPLLVILLLRANGFWREKYCFRYKNLLPSKLCFLYVLGSQFLMNRQTMLGPFRWEVALYFNKSTCVPKLAQIIFDAKNKMARISKRLDDK